MRNIFQFYKSVFGKITLLLALSFFAFGCHTGMEPVPIPQTTVKKEGTSRIPGEPPRNNTETNTKVKIGKNQKGPETSLQRDASGLLLPANKPAPKPLSCPTNTKSTVVAQRHTQRDPFVLPAILQGQKPAMQEPPSLAPGQQIVSNQLKKNKDKPSLCRTNRLFRLIRRNPASQESLITQKIDLYCCAGIRYREFSAAVKLWETDIT